VDMIRKNAEAASLTATEMDKISNMKNGNYTDLFRAVTVFL